MPLIRRPTNAACYADQKKPGSTFAKLQACLGKVKAAGGDPLYAKLDPDRIVAAVVDEVTADDVLDLASILLGRNIISMEVTATDDEEE